MTTMTTCALLLLPPALAPVQDRAESRFGIDYVFPLMAEYRDERWPRAYAETGAGWVNFASVGWQATEPVAPRAGRHAYRWQDLDRAVEAWQRHGFHVVISLRLGSGWFAGPIRYRPDVDVPLGELMLRNSDRLPADLVAYRAWITALVERYDGDGAADMPGLARPILHYQLGNEYSNPAFWTGTLDDYATLLGATAAAARGACADAKIVSNGIRWNDLFHGDPDGSRFEETFAAFLARLPSDGWRDGWRRHREIVEGTVALAGDYDILDAGGNGGYPGMSAGYMAWIRRELAEGGLRTTIWDIEARCEPALVAEPLTRFHPELEVPGGQRVLRELRSDPSHAAYRAEQARLLVQVFVTRFAAGFEKVFMGMASDWDGTAGALATANPYVGLLDRDGDPHPAFYALRLVVAKLDGFARAERMSAEPGVELYRFTFDGRPTAWVAWLAEERVRGMDEPLPRRRIPPPAAGLLWETPTTCSDPAPRALGDSIDLTPTPVILVQGTP